MVPPLKPVSIFIDSEVQSAHPDLGFVVETDIASGNSDVGSISDFTFHSVHTF